MATRTPLSTVQAAILKPPQGAADRAVKLARLKTLEQKVLWLAVWMVHHANHIRPKRDGLKVGGHQASSASVATLMTALYMDVLRPADRVAVKPHASPVYHAIQYLFGRQTRERLERFRALGGAQSYPSRTKDADEVDFSTGSVGLGVAMTSFAALVQDYVHQKQLIAPDVPKGRMVAIVGDAEFDEGNVFEALLEGWKHDVRNVWWIVDYNRQSLDAVVSDRLFHHFDTVFRDMGWRVITLKYGHLLEEAFARPGGDALRTWIDECPNSAYSALAFQGGKAWRAQLLSDLGSDADLRALIGGYDDQRLHALMTNLGGHDMETVLTAFHSVTDDTPTCFIAYTIKGFGLPFAGHKDNHAGLMTPEQIATLKRQLTIPDGSEWERFAGLESDAVELDAFIRAVPFNASGDREFVAPRVEVPPSLDIGGGSRTSTQEAFGRLLAAIAREHPGLAQHIVTTSPDVTVSTNLGSWVNRRGIYHRDDRAPLPPETALASPQTWRLSPDGQHLELGIAENNLFILLAAFGLAAPLFGARVLPVGTVYDPFIARGLDALNYACYQGARFLLAGTPSGVTLAPEGGAHQSIYTPLIGIGQPGLTAFEPAYVDELAEITRWSLEHLQADDGGAVYLRLSTRPLDQPSRELSPGLRADILAGGYWLIPPGSNAEMALVCCGPVVSEASAAHAAIAEDIEGLGLLVVTSPDRLHRDWLRSRRTPCHQRAVSHLERLLRPLAATAGLVTVIDGHPSTLSWIAAVAGHRIVPLGVERFGQSGDIVDLYRTYGIDADSITEAAARLCVV